MKLLVYSDGASRGNPGLAAAGWVILDSTKTVLKQGKRFLGVATNNEAEYQAVTLALGDMHTLVGEVEEITFFLDSLLVVEQLKGRYRLKSPTLKLHYARVQEALRALNLPKTQFIHVPREHNAIADSLANQALDEHI